MAKFNNLQELNYMWDSIRTYDSPGGALYPACRVYGAPRCYTRIQKTKVPPHGRSISIRAHQLALLWSLQCLALPEDLETSHLCGNKACILPGHLRAEPHYVNMQRTECHRWRNCTGHPQEYPDMCVL